MVGSGPGLVAWSSPCSCLCVAVSGKVAFFTTLVTGDGGGIPSFPLVISLLLGGEGTLITPVINPSLRVSLPSRVEVVGFKDFHPLDDLIQFILEVPGVPGLPGSVGG